MPATLLDLRPRALARAGLWRVLRPHGVRRVARDGFWFVDVPRTSSTSIRSELGRRFGVVHAKQNGTMVSRLTRQLLPPHLTAREARQTFGDELWSRLFTFAFVRNPWDRTVSMYCFRQQRKNFKEGLTFRDYVRQLVRVRDSPDAKFSYAPLWLEAFDFVADDDGRIMVTHLGKYETRQQDLRVIGGVLGCPELGQSHLQMSRRPRGSYVDYYDAETRDLIGQFYRRDVEAFGYSFGR